MIFRELQLVQSEEMFNEYKEVGFSYIEDPDNINLRNSILDRVSIENLSDKKEYEQDYKIGMIIYEELSKVGFDASMASNNKVWAYISLLILPDLVYKRFGERDIRFYKSSNRIWLKTIWWFIHLSFNNNIEDTGYILESMSTDVIMQLVDRVGNYGFDVELSRIIIYKFYEHKKNEGILKNNTFRRIMTMHNLVVQSVSPRNYDGGLDGYVDMLIKEACK